MKKDISSLTILITGLSLFTGIIGAIFFFFFIAQQRVTPAAPSRTEPPISISPTLSATTPPTREPTASSKTETKFCGGIAGRQCSTGYTCKLSGNYPDAGGTCIKAEATTPPEQTMCTMEAKECPDGSYVGRSGPNCEFAVCPKGI